MTILRLRYLCWLAALCCGCPASSAPAGSDTGVVSMPSAAPAMIEQGLAQAVLAAVPAPAKSDPRTPIELAAAACSGPEGKWLCFKVPQPKTVMALGTTPITPASWSVPAWFVDDQNISGNASDGNACTTSGSPCRTKAEIVYHRWGTSSPYINGTVVTITYLSADVDGSDPGYFTPQFMNGGRLIHTASLPTPTFVGTLLAVTAKNTATNQALQSTFTVASGAVAARMLLVNSTRGNSRAFAQRNVSGATWQLDQPYAPYTSGIPFIIAENNAWANGDAIQGYALLPVNLAVIGGTERDFIAPYSAAHLVQQINVFNPTPFGNFYADGAAYFGFVESSSNFNLSIDGPTSQAVASSVVNCSLKQVLIANSPPTIPTAIVTGGNFHDLRISGGSVSGDPIIDAGGHCTLINPIPALGAMYLDGANLFLQGYTYLGGAIYGTGSLTINGGSTLDIEGLTGVQALPMATIYMGRFAGPTTGYSNATSAGVTTVHGGITVNGTNLDAAAGATGFGGYAYGGGATICKQGVQP